jgi:diaminopimelate epimerase
MQFHFYKYQGTGNDFVLFDNRNMQFPAADTDLIERLCDRRFGIGADGLMLLEHSEAGDFKMVYFNSDGKESSMCGNGGRCISAFAKRLGIVENEGRFDAIDGEHVFFIRDNLVSLKMTNVPVISKVNDDFVLSTGSPHYVSFRNAIQDIHIVDEARKIRYNDRFSREGINVNFVEKKQDGIYMRTYERGVEDETLSCGTGTVAAALCVAYTDGIDKGKMDITTPGGKLSVSFEKTINGMEDIWLTGPAEFVFEGTIDLN